MTTLSIPLIAVASHGTLGVDLALAPCKRRRAMPQALFNGSAA